MKRLALLLLLAAAGANATPCAITSVSGLSFGAYDALAAGPDDTSGSIAVTCYDATPDVVQVWLSPGISGSFAPRTMASGTSRLAYNVFLDASRLTVWGDGNSGTGIWGPTDAQGTITIPVYGRAPAHQDVSAGTYADTLTITIQY